MDLEPRRAGRDRQPLIAELADDVERLARRLLEREPQLVGRHRAFDLGADVRGGPEIAVRGDQPVERLVRALKVVVADEVIEPALRVDDVREHGAAEKLVPERLPEPLDLAERLRMLRPATNVLHAHPREQLLELGLAAPHGVLPAVVSEHFGRLAIRGHATVERLHHQRRLLVVRERVPDHEAAVVVHEHAHVEPLGPPQPEREDVGLPQLVRHRTFEAPRRMLALQRHLRCLDEPLGVENLPHFLFTHAQRLEPRQYVANSPAAPVLMFAFERDHVFVRDRVGRRARTARLGTS